MYCAEEEEVDEAEKATDMCELYDRDHRREWQMLRWQHVVRPRSLHIVSLHNNPTQHKRENTRYSPPSQGLKMGSCYVPLLGP